MEIDRVINEFHKRVCPDWLEALYHVGSKPSPERETDIDLYAIVSDQYVGREIDYNLYRNSLQSHLNSKGIDAGIHFFAISESDFLNGSAEPLNYKGRMNEVETLLNTDTGLCGDVVSAYKTPFDADYSFFWVWAASTYKHILGKNHSDAIDKKIPDHHVTIGGIRGWLADYHLKMSKHMETIKHTDPKKYVERLAKLVLRTAYPCLVGLEINEKNEKSDPVHHDYVTPGEVELLGGLTDAELKKHTIDLRFYNLMKLYQEKYAEPLGIANFWEILDAAHEIRNNRATPLEDKMDDFEYIVNKISSVYLDYVKF